MPTKPKTFAQRRNGGKRRRNWQKSAASRGYGRDWQRFRVHYLAQHPLCRECKRHGRLTGATVIDHIVPHRGDYGRFWDVNNMQPLCKPCHDRKTGSGR